jgi:hypothetical protein
VIESILMCATPVATFNGTQPLTQASAFFFEREGRLFLVTSRHVMIDEPSGHAPDRIEIELHTDPDNVAATTGFSIPLYRDGKATWRQGSDSAGGVDVAVIEIDRPALPKSVVYRAFDPEHIPAASDAVGVGTPVLILGFPLGFRDWLHHIPVARHAIVASSYGLRFQGKGHFLTDGRTHRGSSGAPVILRAARPGPAHRDLPWVLLGIHSSRLDVGGREIGADEALGLNCTWYADILMTLTAG